MARAWLALLTMTALSVTVAGQTVQRTDRLPARRYVDGERAQYLMKGVNEGTAYEVRLTATTIRNADGQFVEEFAWSNLTNNGAPRRLSPAAQAFRLAVTTGGAMPFQLPDLSKAEGIVGPVTDLMTFYADLFIATRANLRRAGDHFVFRNPAPASWADGRTVITGEDHVDFDFTLSQVDEPGGVAVLSVKHIPPAEPKIRLTADWMRAAVADTPNNWVMVTKTAGGYTAEIGKETFDVELRLALADGKILSATMANPVIRVTRTCSDDPLTQCSEPQRSTLIRRIEMALVRD